MSTKFFGPMSGPRNVTWKWLLLDNDGSFHGYFDWVPIHLRVGPWSPFAVFTLVGLLVGLIALKPPLDLQAPAAASYTATWMYVDLALAGWVVVIWVVIVRAGYGKLTLFTYTGWSWTLIGSSALTRAGAAALAARDASDSLRSVAQSLAFASETMRFASLMGATVTFSVWNFVLVPVILGSSAMSKEGDRRKFLVWNCSFLMVNVHVINLPMACANVVFGGGARALGGADLYCALVVVAAYACVYLLLLDRLGVHLYPIFSPRTHWCVLSYGLLWALYYGAWRGWAELQDAVRS